MWIALVSAMTSGVLMAVQGALNSLLSKTTGLMEATLLVHVTGTVVIVVGFVAVRLGKTNLANLLAAPWYAYLGGLIGVFIVYLVALSIPKAGAANATTAIIVGQVLMAIVIDHLGLFDLKQAHFTWSQGAGLLLLAIGAKLLLKY